MPSWEVRLALLAGAALAVALSFALAGCGDAGRGARPLVTRRFATGPLDASYQPRSVGRGPRYRPPSGGPKAAAGLALPARAGGSLTCHGVGVARFGVHFELFVAGRVVVIPAGIGVAPPFRRVGAEVVGGRCSYPVRTVLPTGVLELVAGTRLSLADAFSVWGQPLSPARLAGFSARRGERVRAWVNGRPWPRDPGSIPLSRHAQIVLELGARVAPHPQYRFAPGL